MKESKQPPRIRRRAKELYDADSPFWPKVVENQKTYSRKRKHKKRDMED